MALFISAPLYAAPLPSSKPVFEKSASPVLVPPVKPVINASSQNAPPKTVAPKTVSGTNFDAVSQRTASRSLSRTAQIKQATPEARPHHAKSLPSTHVKGGQGLSGDDIARYKNIFALQKAGEMAQADAVIADLQDHRLMGHVLHQRYMHPTAYISKFAELKEWLHLYAGHAGAREIYKLAGIKGGAKANDLPQPRSDIAFRSIEEPTVVYGKNYRGRVTNDGRDLQKNIHSLLRRNRPSQAVKLLERDKRAASLDHVQQDQQRGHIAARYFYGGHYRKAYEVSTKAVSRSQFHVPRAAWIAGLTAWQKGGYKSAAQFFGMAAKSPYASGWTQAAGSYWAARSYMRLGQVDKVGQWLEFAQAHPRTFYGMLATRALGRDFDFNWDVPQFTQESQQILDSTKEGARAIALVAVGENIRAEKELMRLSPNGNDALRRAMLAFAGYAELPGLAMQLGSRMSPENGALYDAALYPVGAWMDAQDYDVDPALMFAMMRQESRFDAAAESRRGASGLMQIMPATASYIAGDSFYKSKAGRKALLDPKVNIALAESYIHRLLKHPAVKGDFVSMLVAYNAGPGNLNKWRRTMRGADDPLLFIESLPAAETRAYVERVLSNYWIYRLRAAHYQQNNDELRSIDMLAQGQWPRYSIDQGNDTRFASNN